MTASEDGTMKFWMLEKAGVARRYIPNFDRTKEPIFQMYTTAFTVLTTDKASRLVQQ